MSLYRVTDASGTLLRYISAPSADEAVTQYNKNKVKGRPWGKAAIEVPSNRAMSKEDRPPTGVDPLAPKHLIFVDVEARGESPVNGVMTEFSAVHESSGATFHGILFESTPDPEIPAIPVIGERVATDEDVAKHFVAWLNEVTQGSRRPVFVSDNPAYDFMWIAGLFDRAGMPNPFGHPARCIMAITKRRREER